MLGDLRVKEYTKDEARLLNSLQLALIGDAGYEVFIRNSILAKNDQLSANKIHRTAIGYVKAKSQAKAIHALEEELTEEESYVYKRGRNTKSATVPKNADVRDYRMATGFEALVGYLYLIGDLNRLTYIFEKSLEVINQ